jgi:hypothetical protein
MPGESDDEYRKFLIFRGLGPDRSMLKAYKKYAPERSAYSVSGDWSRAAKRNHWQERARAFDKDCLDRAGKASVYELTLLLKDCIRVMGKAIRSGNVKPESWSQLLEGITLVSQIIPPSAVAAMLGPEPASPALEFLMASPQDGETALMQTPSVVPTPASVQGEGGDGGPTGAAP